MADWGAVVMGAAPAPMVIDAYALGSPLIYDAVLGSAPSGMAVTEYLLAGTTPCPPSGPTVPTTGQTWPRGAP